MLNDPSPIETFNQRDDGVGNERPQGLHVRLAAEGVAPSPERVADLVVADAGDVVGEDAAELCAAEAAVEVLVRDRPQEVLVAPLNLRVNDAQELHEGLLHELRALSLRGELLEEGPGGSVRGEQANFTGLVLGCIEAKSCK